MTATGIWMARAAVLGLSLLSLTNTASARAAGTAHARWNPAHVDQLPAELRGALERACGPDLRAEHEFATYFHDGRVIVLHPGHLRCGQAVPACSGSRCLRQVYVSDGKRVRFVGTYSGR